jgi:hypothetical protein
MEIVEVISRFLITKIISITNVNFIHLIRKFSFLASNESNNKSHKSDQKRPHSQSNKHKLDNTFTDNEQYKHRKLETPTRATISEIPSTSKPRESDSKTELFVCRFPEYAVGEYVGYRIKVSKNK